MPWPPPIQALPIPKRTFLLSKLMEQSQGDREPYTRCTERVADDFCGFARQRLAGESFIDLDEIDLIENHPRAHQGHLDGGTVMSYSRVGYQIDEGDFPMGSGIHKLGVLGMGLMGSGIAQVAATRNFDTVVTDVSPEMLAKAWSGFATASALGGKLSEIQRQNRHCA